MQQIEDYTSSSALLLVLLQIGVALHHPQSRTKKR